MKILYAAGRFTSSKYQLYQFIKNAPKCDLKISGYHDHIPFNIDYTLNFIDNYQKPKENLFTNINLKIYADQIKKFKPDLIISDLCIYSSIIGIELGIPVWQYSPYLLLWRYNYTITLSPFNFNLYFKKLINRKYYKYIITNSDKNLANTHINVPAQNKNAREFRYNIEHITPHHELGKINNMCKHNMIISNDISYKGNKLLQNHFNDTVNHSLINYQSFDNLTNNNLLENSEDYYCHIKNSDVIITEPNPLFLSDCYYNQRHCYILCDAEYPMEDYFMASINNSLNQSEFINDKLTRNFYKKKKTFQVNTKKYIQELL